MSGCESTFPPESTMMAVYRQSGPPDDHILAMALITIWATRTGRMLRAVPISELSAGELVAFWADDQMEEPPPADPGCARP
jgi:hypothetical protein